MQNTDFNQLKEKRFILVTGKGGTGKSITAATLACALSAMGKRVVLGEIAKESNKKTRVHEIFQSPASTDTSIKVKNPLDPRKSIEIISIDQDISLKEYLEIKLGALAAKLFLKNKFIQVFFNMVPGLSDLLCLGKIWHLLHTEEIDTFILDAPSSGHALSLVQSPERFSKIIKAGTTFQESSKMKEFFSDPSKSTILYLAIPEKMSLEESKEYYSLFQKINFKYFLLINKCIEKIENEVEVEEDNPLYPAWSHYQRLTKNKEFYVNEFNDFYASPFKVPYFFSKNNSSLLKDYAQFLLERL